LPGKGGDVVGRVSKQAAGVVIDAVEVQASLFGCVAEDVLLEGVIA
jgi:hypothetical protein